MTRALPGFLAIALLPCLFVGLVWCETASAQSAPSTQEVRELLSGFEDGPGPDDWRAIGEGVLPALSTLAGDTRAETFLRQRAVGAASAFSTRASRAILVRALRDREPMVVREAILGLGRAFGESALREITPFLASRDTALREAAISALGAMRSEAALAALRGARERETDEVLREQIDAALQAEGTPG